MNPRILLVDDDALFAESVRLFLENDPLSVVVAHDVASAKALLSEKAVSLLVTDDRLPDGRGLELTDPALIDEAPVIVVTAHPNFEHAVEAVRRGAVDYLTKPVELAELRHAIHRSLGRDRMRRLVEARRRAEARQPPRADGAIASLLATVRRAEERRPDALPPVLLTGETGTGKTHLARLLHEASPRAGGPFVAANCAALPAALLEAELFGTKSGAFTGAETREGLLELASGGTLFLDEIGELSVELQAKLLTALDAREIRRVGGRRSRRVDFRLMTATNRDLEAEVQAGRFRQDIFYRLNVLRLRIPPLRERLEELPELIETILAECLPGVSGELAPGERERLARHDWPGNVRELRNVLERCVLDSEPGQPWRPSRYLTSGVSRPPEAAPFQPVALAELERQHILRTLEHFEGRKDATARALGISPATLRRRLRAYGL